MKSFFSRLNGDIQASSSNESSYKFWIPSKAHVERSPPNPIPIHPDVAASQGEKRSRPLKSTHIHGPKIPLHDLPTAPLETQASHSNDMSKHTTRSKLGTSYTQNYPPPSSRNPRPHEHSTRYQIPSHEGHGTVHPTGARTSHDSSTKPHRGGKYESVAPTPREIWLPSTTPVVSKQDDQPKPLVQGTTEKPERYRENGDEKDRELERRGKDRGKDRREREREREWEEGRTKEREREERERTRAKERERTLEKEREMARAKREQDRNLEIDQRRDRDKAERDRREQERDLDREGEKGKNRTKDRSRKESSNLTRGMEKARDSDVLYDGERPKQDERRARHRDRAMGGVKDDNRESHKDRERIEKEPRDRLGGQIKHRVEVTDSEHFAGRVKTPAPDRERRKDLGVGWHSDTHTGNTRKLLRKTSNTPPNQPSKGEEGDSSDSSTRPKLVRQILTRRHRGEEGGSYSKVIHSRQGMPTEPLTSTKSSVVKATIVTILDDVQLPVPPTSQHMPIYMPPKESNAVNSGLPSTITSLNVASTREAEPPPRRETVKSHIPDELPHTAENVSKPREIDISVVRRPPSRGPVQSQNHIPQSTRESVYIHKPKHSQPSPTTTHDKLRTPGSSLLPEIPHISTQAEGSKAPNHSLERLPDSKPKKEVEVDLAPSVFYKVQHGNPPQSAGAVPSRQPTVFTLPVTVDPVPPQLNPDSRAYPLPPGWQNNVNAMPLSIPNQERNHAPASSIDVDPKIAPSKNSQSRSNGQESIGIAITRPSTTTGLRQNNAGKNLRSHNISFSRSDAQNSIGASIPRPSTATAIKQSSSGPSSHQTSNATSNKLNPLVEEAQSSMFPRPSIPRQDSIPVTNPQPVSEKGSRFSAQLYNMTPTLSKGHATVLPEDVTGQQDVPGSRRQGHTGAANANIISPPENPISQTSTLHPKPDNLRNATTLTSLDTIAPNGRSPTPASNFTAPQIQIQRPPTSLSTRDNSIPPASVIVPQIQLHPVSEKGSRFSAQPYNMTPSSGPSLSKGHATEDVTGRQDASGSRRQEHTGTADLNITSPPENFTLQASTMLNTKADNLRNAITPLTSLGAIAPSTRFTTPASNFTAPQIQIQRPSTSLSTRDNSIPPASVIVPQIQLHPVSEKGSRFSAQPYNMTPSSGPSLSKGHATEDVTGRQDASGSRRQEHTGTADLIITSPPENSISQASTMLNPKTENLRSATTPLVPLGAIAPSARSTTPASNFTAPQIQIQRPPTSLSTRNNYVLPTLPSAVTVPQIQIHHLITTTGTGNKSESTHTDHISIPRTTGAGADLDTPDVIRLGTANVLPIQVDQPQDFLGTGNKFHRPVHLIPTSTSGMNDANVRPSVNERTLPSHGEDSHFNNLRVGSSQEVTTQTLVNKQMNNDLAQGSPSLGFFNDTFSEVLQSPVVRRSDQEGRLPMKGDGKIIYTVLETDKDDGTNQTINKKASDSLVNRDAVRNVLPKEPEVPSVERLATRKDLHIDIHNSKVTFPQILTERSSKSPSTPSQPRIQHPGFAEILLSSSFNKNDNESPGLSTAHQLTNSPTVFSKSGLSLKFQGPLDKQRPDDKLVSPKSSPARQSPSDLHYKEEERSHESPKRQLQQSSITFFRSAYLENLLSDPHHGDSTSSNLPSSSSHPSNVLHPSHTTSSVPDGITRPFLASHINNKKLGQSGSSFPEVPIGTGGPSQVEESASRKIRPSSILDSKPFGNSIPHYRATTPLHDSTSTSRHQHSMSLPVHLVPSANDPSVDGPLRSAAHPPLHHHSASQTKPGYIPPPNSQILGPNITHAASDSEEILMTPSSLARSVMLKPTVSQQSVAPSVSSQTARKGTGLFTMFRSKTPAQPPPQYEIWHPKKTAEPNVAPSGTLTSSFTFPEQEKTSAPTPVPATSVPIPNERSSQKSKIFTPFRYLTTKRNRAVSLVSVEAQDGTAPSTIVGSPTVSMLSQAPFQTPPVRDPMKATEEWRDKEDEPHRNGKKRRQRPGVVIEAEERPEGDRRERPKRTRTRHIKSSSKPS